MRVRYGKFRSSSPVKPFSRRAAAPLESHEAGEGGGDRKAQGFGPRGPRIKARAKGRRLLTQRVPRRIQLLGKKARSADVRVHALDQAVVGCGDFLFVRPRSQSEDVKGLSGAQGAGRDAAPTTRFLLPSLAFSLGSSPPSLLVLLQFPPSVCCIGPLSKKARERAALFAESRPGLGAFMIGGDLAQALGHAIVLRLAATALLAQGLETGLRSGVSLIGGKLEEPRRLAIVLRQAAATMFIEEREIALRLGESLIGGELEEPRRLAVVLWQSATTLRVKDPEILLRGGVSLIGGELEEPRRLAIILRQVATAMFVEDPEVALRLRETLIGGELVKARGLVIILRQSAAAILAKDPETALRDGVSAVSGQLA